MYKFTYPADKWDERKLDKGIILSLIRKHHAMSVRKAKNKRYYNGEHDILSRQRENDAPNNKVVCNHAKDISDTATGYFMGNKTVTKNLNKSVQICTE